MKRLKEGHQKFSQMKYRKFAGRIPKIRKISEKRGHFFGRNVDVHKGRGLQAHLDACRQGRGSKPRFSCGRRKLMALNTKEADVNIQEGLLEIAASTKNN